MIYLVGENVFTFNSGTEFSQFERLNAFNNNDKRAVLLLRNYNRMLSNEVKKHGLRQEDVINMYDYFQGTVKTRRKEQSLRLLDSIPLTDYHIVGIDNNYSNIEYKGKKIGEIRVMPATVGLVGSIEYYDSLGQTAVKEYWDWRGFKSMVETYHPDGSVAMQQYLRQDGSPAIEVTHMYIGDKVLPTMWKLINYKGRDWQFRTEDQLFTFFLNEINNQEPGTFISDRRTLDSSVLNVENADKKISYLHSVPFKDYNRPQQGLMDVYERAVNGENGKEFDYVILPTQDQADEVAKLTTAQSQVVAAPDSYVKAGKSKELGREINLVYVGRLATEKHTDDVIKAFKHISNKLPEAKLKLQGYFGSGEYEKELKELVKKLDLTDKVEFVAYDPAKQVLQDGTLFLNASHSEGFGMNMLEALASGIPVVTYASDYTRNNLIKDGVNGFNVVKTTPVGLANKVLELLGDSKEYANLSQGAIQTAKENSEANFMKQWDKFID